MFVCECLQHFYCSLNSHYFVQEWVDIHHENYIFQSRRSRICEYSASGGTSFGKPSRHNSRFIHCTGVICEKCTQHCPCITVYTNVCVCVCVCVCAWWVPRNVMEVHNNLCLQVLFHFCSHLKEEQMGFLNPWWCCGTWVHHFTQNEL